jgi:hypothetical protein
MNVPIRRGTARRLGLRLPMETVAYVIEPDVDGFSEKIYDRVRRARQEAGMTVFPWGIRGRSGS